MSGAGYEKMHRIASGGLADVYLGRRLGEGGFERLVALKIMHPEFTGDRELVRIFLNQARIAASVRHPNVVPVLDVEAEGSDVRFVLEYVEGTSLEKLIATSSAAGAPIPIEAALRVVQDVLAGLQAIHESEGPGGVALGLIHYNLTPRSLLIGADGTTRITDFGVDPKHIKGPAVSSDEWRLRKTYSAPEVLQGGRMDARSDIFSVGVILWELLAGRDYSTAEGGRQMPPAPSSVNASLPRAFDEVCLRALVSEPAARHASAEELSLALAEVADATSLRSASSAVIAQLVEASEDEPPTRMKRDVDDAPPRGPLETVVLEDDDPGTVAPRSEMGTMRMEWPAAEGSSIRDSDSDSDMRTVMAPVMHAPRAPHGEPLSSAPPPMNSEVPPVDPRMGPLPVYEDRSTPVPAGLGRSGGSTVKLMASAAALLAAITIGWFVRELVGSDDSPPVTETAEPTGVATAVATATPEPTGAASSRASAAIDTAPLSATDAPPTQSATALTAPASSVRQPPPPRRPPPRWPPPPRRPPPTGDKGIIRDAPF